MIKFKPLSVVFISAIFFSSIAKPTSIQSIDFETLVNLSEFVFDGVVTNVEPRWSDDNTRIHTYVSFQIKDVIKGRYEGEQVVLRFAGGEVGKDSFLYQGMIYPSEGEAGIYFVETLSKNLVNPLVGWSQGHFIIDNERIMTNLGQPVKDVGASFEVGAGKLSDGVVAGMTLAKSKENGMSVASFKSKISTIMD